MRDRAISFSFVLPRIEDPFIPMSGHERSFALFAVALGILDGTERVRPCKNVSTVVHVKGLTIPVSPSSPLHKCLACYVCEKEQVHL